MGININDLRVADFCSTDRQLHLSRCVLIDRLVPWYLFLILNEAENLGRDGLAGGVPLASKVFRDWLPVGRMFPGTGLDHIKLSGHFGV